MHVRLGKHMIQIDKEDVHLLRQGHSFQVQDRSTKNYERYYVKARRKGGPYLHRMIMEASPDIHVDHINGDGRDNRRCNLRLTNRSKNMANQRRAPGASGYRGVIKMADGPNWSARITVKNISIYSCGHATPEDAAKVRDEMALKHFGEHTVLNFPRKGHVHAKDPFLSNRPVEAA